MDTGQVRLEFRHFPFLGEESQWAAEASECAARQGQFWPFHDRLYAEWRGEGSGAFSIPNLKRYARDLELDTQAFDDCLDSGSAADIVASDRRLGEQAGVESTPTIFINGEIVLGNQPFQVFQMIIEQELADAP